MTKITTDQIKESGIQIFNRVISTIRSYWNDELFNKVDKQIGYENAVLLRELFFDRKVFWTKTRSGGFFGTICLFSLDTNDDIIYMAITLDKDSNVMIIAQAHDESGVKYARAMRTLLQYYFGNEKLKIVAKLNIAVDNGTFLDILID